MTRKLLAALFFLAHACAASLVTQGPWIVDSATGVRVRLRCANWYGAHQELFVVGGLELRSVSDLAQSLKDTGANCVRIPYSIELAKYNPTVAPASVAGISASDLCNSTARALDVMDCVVHHLQARGILIIFNNHNSWGTWVGAGAAKHDQGLWNLPGYTTEDWIQSLETILLRYKGRIAGIDLRNEIHDQDGVRITWGETNNPNTDWLAATTAAYERIHRIDPEALAIVGGLCWNTDLRAMAARVGPVRAFDNRKLVYTVHVYTFTFWWTEGDDVVTKILAPAFAAAAAVLLAASAACFAATYQASPHTQFYRQLNAPEQAQTKHITAAAAAWALAAASCLFFAGWLAVAASFSAAATSAGCSPLAQDAQWLVIAAAVLTSLSGACLLCCLCSLSSLTCTFSLACALLWAGLLTLSFAAVGFYLSSEAAYRDYLGVWALQNRPVPVWVGEFGTGTPSFWKFKLIWDFINGKHELDFAYWAFNGRKWSEGAWKTEPFGLVDETYTRWRFPDLIKTLFH